MKKIQIPKTSLVVLSGSAGCGKSSFASRHFRPTQVVSSDHCRAMVSDSEEDMPASGKAFKVFRLLIDSRLSLGKLTVSDSTALTPKARRELITIGRKHDFQLVLIIFDIPFAVCSERNLSRARNVPSKVLLSHRRLLDRTLAGIHGEDFDSIYIIKEEELDSINVEIVPLPVEVPLRN